MVPSLSKEYSPIISCHPTATHTLVSSQFPNLALHPCAEATYGLPEFTPGAGGELKSSHTEGGIRLGKQNARQKNAAFLALTLRAGRLGAEWCSEALWALCVCLSFFSASFCSWKVLNLRLKHAGGGIDCSAAPSAVIEVPRQLTASDSEFLHDVLEPAGS